jgi:predicted TIM-barrel fold metal-dependent hydrolase
MADQETWDTMDRYVVISSDSHAGADLRDYRPYLDARLRDEFDEWADGYQSPFDDLIHHTAHRNWDSGFRMQELDADGIAGEIVIPNTIPPFFPTSALIVVSLPRTKEEFGYRWAGVQAHNRWVVDFVGLEPKRRRGLLQIFPNDVDLAMQEMRWAADTGAFGGVLLVPVPPGHPVPPFFHSCYEPLWALCEELDFPIAVHNGTAPDMPLDQPASNTLVLLKGDISRTAMITDLIVSGVLERHPDLKLVPTESSMNWLTLAEGLDLALAPMRAGASNRTMGQFGGPHLDQQTLSPSEYVRRQVYWGISGPAATPSNVALRADVGADKLLWGTDYPHEEGTTPHSKQLIRWLFHDVDEADTRKILAGNIAKLYGFDLDALAPVAKRIGPEVAYVHTPFTAADIAEQSNPISEWMDRPYAGGAALDRGRAADSSF